MEFVKSKLGYRLDDMSSVDRDNTIVELCRSKNVVHFGCVDYPLLEERIRSGQLLHLKLMSSASRIWGVDLDADGITKLSEKYNVPDLLVGNIENLGPIQDRFGKIDMVVAGEIFEHLNNVGLALSEIYKILQPNGLLVVTVPNALALRIWFHSLRRRENVHPDHVCYFSPYTLWSLLRRYNFETQTIYGYWYPSTRPIVNKIKQRLFRMISRFYPF